MKDSLVSPIVPGCKDSLVSPTVPGCKDSLVSLIVPGCKDSLQTWSSTLYSRLYLHSLKTTAIKKNIF